MDTSNAEVIWNALSSQIFVVSETVLNFGLSHHIRAIWTSFIHFRASWSARLGACTAECRRSGLNGEASISTFHGIFPSYVILANFSSELIGLCCDRT